MGRIARSTLLLLTMVLWLGPSLAQAQSALEPYTPVVAQLAAGEQHTYTFRVTDTQPVSFIAQATQGDLDPSISISNSSGEVIISNDDAQYPQRTDALLEAVTLLRTDQYTLTVSGYGSSAGEYQLLWLNGYSTLADGISLDGNWRGSRDELTIDQADEGLTLSLAGPDRSATAYRADGAAFSDAFAQVRVQVEGTDGWVVGLTTRQQDSRTAYRFELDDGGLWRFIAQQNGEERIIRDWTSHPAIVPGASEFDLSLLVSEDGYDFFYNQSQIGHLFDDQLTAPGRFGLSIATPSAIGSEVTAVFQQLRVTTPALIEGRRVIPQQLILSSPNNMGRELQRRGLAPGEAVVSLTVSESFVESSRPGVERVMLGRGATFGEFALASTLTWTATESAMTGCGLIFQAQDDTRYALAYADQQGGVGVSTRTGEEFSPGIFDELEPPLESRRNLLVVVRQGQALYYVDGAYVGAVALEPVAGTVGNAVVNFDPIRTSCQFRDTWVFSW